MKVNGEQIQLTKATTLEEFLKEQGYNIQRIATLTGSVKSKYPSSLEVFR